MSNKKGLLALSPLILLIALIALFTGYSAEESHKDTSLSLTVAFMISSIYAVAISGGMPIRKRIDTYSRGAGANNLMLMLWIYVLAGAFAASAKAMGAVDATVNLALSLLPASMILPGLFLAACFISLSVGTSVGTIVALVPIAAGLAHSVDANLALTVAIIVGGAYFGDNLSFISDTTVVATQTQGCQMSDKFRVNALIVIPAAIIILIIYGILGAGTKAPTHIDAVQYMKVLPYSSTRHGYCWHECDGSTDIGFHSLWHHRHHRWRLRHFRMVFCHGKWRDRNGRTHHHRYDGWRYA